MKVLVTGAGGFLGGYVVDRLVEKGHAVRAMVRPNATASFSNPEVEVFHADLRVHDGLVEAFEGIEAVVHLAAGTSGSEDAQFAASVVATERLLEAMSRSAVKRLVHVSSLVVYDWTRTKGTMDETSPLETAVYKMGAYTIAKIWQERVVEKYTKLNFFDLTVLRPGFIWGPKHADIAGMGRRFGRVHLMFGPFARLPLTHVMNCADCIATSVQNRAAVGHTFNVVDDDQVRVWHYARQNAKRTGRGGIFVPVPYAVGLGIAQLATFTSRILFGDKGKLPSFLTARRFESQFKPIRFANDKLRKNLGWQPPHDFDDCLRLTYEK